jgi:hypothetical protein
VNVATSQLRSERKWLEGKVERLCMQHTEAVRDNSVAENKSQNLLYKVTVLEKENEDLDRRLNDEKDTAAEAKIEAKSACAEAQATRKRAAELELEVKSMRTLRERTKSATHAGVDQTHTLFVDAYRDLGVETAPFDKSGGEVGTRFLGWLQEELACLPSIMTSLMSYASLVSNEGATNALAHEGCRHFEAFDRSNEDFDACVFHVEDDMLKLSIGELYDRMWGPHGRSVIRERADRALAQVCLHP